MELAMCLSCGRFVQVIERNGTAEPPSSACHACGETSFRHHPSGERIDVE